MGRPQAYEGLQKNFNFDVIRSFPGYNSASDKTNIVQGTAILGSKNIYKSLRGTLATRPGLLKRGSADSTSARVVSSFEWSTSLGRTYPLRYCNGKIQFESDIVTSGTYVWYDLATGLTATRVVFDSWWNNTSKKDQLLWTQDDSKIYVWQGSLALFVSYAANVITLDRNAATAGFSTTGGTVVIGGVNYTYTGVSGSTLTGTSDASAAVANSVVTDIVSSSSNTPDSAMTNNFLKVIKNQVYVGSYTSRLVYISKASNYADYSQSTPRAVGDGDTLTLDANVNGITVHGGNALISAGANFWYEVSFNQITVGTNLSEQVVVDRVQGSGLNGAKAHEFIDTWGNDVVFLDKANQLRAYGNFRNLFQAKFPLLSLAVADELANTDFSYGHLRVVDRTIYITAPLTGVDYMYETRETINSMGNIVAERFWHPPQVRNVSRFAVIDGVLYGHSNANPMIYKIWDTLQWHDDGPDGEPLPYECSVRFAYNSHGQRALKKSFDKIYVEGYITPGTNLYNNTYYDYQGAENITSSVLNSTSKQLKTFTSISPYSLGESPLGTNMLGDSLVVDSTVTTDQELLPKFRVIKAIEPTDCFEYALNPYSTDVDSRWEILAIGTNVRESVNKPVEITR